MVEVRNWVSVRYLRIELRRKSFEDFLAMDFLDVAVGLDQLVLDRDPS